VLVSYFNFNFTSISMSRTKYSLLSSNIYLILNQPFIHLCVYLTFHPRTFRSNKVQTISIDLHCSRLRVASYVKFYGDLCLNLIKYPTLLLTFNMQCNYNTKRFAGKFRNILNRYFSKYSI
jgi:hypothetical protein